MQRCVLQSTPRPCIAAVSDTVARWFLDLATDACTPTIYVTCDPGANGGFATELECLEECTDFTPPCDRPSCCSPVCALPLDMGSKPGPGPAPSCASRRMPYTNVPVLRWGYSEEECTCVKFKYYGCGGNGNNFETEQDCMHACMH